MSKKIFIKNTISNLYPLRIVDNFLSSSFLLKTDGKIASNNTSKIIPRADLSQSDFADLWWVGDRADGGFVAIQLKNALSTGGFALTTSKSGKGQVAVTLTGHVSIDAQDVVPMVFYSAEA